MTVLHVRRADLGDAQLLRTLTLQAVTDSPESFGLTLSEAEARDEAWWTRHATRVGPGGRHAAFVLAADDGEAARIAYGLRDDAREDIARIGGMWVAPARRRAGGGRMLVDAALAWTREWGARAVELWAPRHELSALRLYAAAGFEATGVEREHRPGMHIVEMRLLLHS